MKPNDVVYDICRCYINDFRTEVNQDIYSTVDGYLRSRHIPKLASCSLHFNQAYHSIEDWRFLRQVEAFFKKNSLFSQGDVCSEAAKGSFLDAEHKCSATNIRLEYFFFKRDQLDPDLKTKLSRMKRYISNVLGDFQCFLNEIPHLVKVTPGATSTNSRKDSLPQLKLKKSLCCTKGAASYLNAIYKYYGFKEPKLEFVDSNRIELVPKNWKTDRTIACEPEGNLPFQLAFDTYGKRRLRRFGINLRDQSANQRAAVEGSINGKLATIDFSAASDSIAYNLVAWLLPYDWFKFLDRMRSPKYFGAFGEGSYQKFSSMGNGTTFVLETLLFAAACYAVGSKEFLVYGDDVVIESHLFPSYLKLTRFLGFTINEEKSFIAGPFRESCGLDSFDGKDVTPFFIRNVDRRKAYLCHLVNGLLHLTIPDGLLEKFLIRFVKDQELPLVAFQESTIAGVHITPSAARYLKTLRTRHFVDQSRNYVPASSKRGFNDLRGYYLWFLSKEAFASLPNAWGSPNVPCSETSSVSIFDHKYVRKWVGWVVPASGIPVHIYTWTENLLTALSLR